MADFKYEIIKNYGKLPSDRGSWNLELNLISFNDRPAKLDLRQWPEDHSRMGKGLTFSQETLPELIALLQKATE